MKRNSVLFVGCGDLGIRTGEALAEGSWQVAGLRRNPSALPARIAGYGGDYTERGSLDLVAALRPDYLVATFNPTERSVEGYRRGFSGAAANLLAGLGDHRPRLIIMVSSTRVFAEQEGGWVDENSPLDTVDPRAEAMIAAEQMLLESGQRVCVVRFAGIYGATGGHLVGRVRRGELSPAHPVRYSNRIHRDDCAGFMRHLMERTRSGVTPAPVYIGVDDRPAPRYEVETWLLRKLGVSAATIEVEPATAAHKRCSNHLLRSTGYQFLYPDYRSGYAAVLAAAGNQ